MSFVYHKSYASYGLNQAFGDQGTALTAYEVKNLADVSGNGQCLHFKVLGKANFNMWVDLDGVNCHDLGQDHPAGHIATYKSAGERHQYILSRYDTVANEIMMEMIKPGHFEGKYRSSMVVNVKNATGSSNKVCVELDYVSDATGCRLFKVKDSKIEDPAALRAELVKKLGIPKREISVGWNVRWDEEVGINVVDSFVFVGDAPADVEGGIHKGIRNALGELLKKDVDETDI